MSFLAPLAAGRIAFQSVAAISNAMAEPLANASTSFAQLLNPQPEEQLSTLDAASGASMKEASTDLLSELSLQIRERLTSLTSGFLEPLSGTVTIELSALGNVYCSGDGTQICPLESAIEADSDLMGYLSKWLDLSGETKFNFDPQSVANATA